jgi:UDP-N-acetylglucosamine acyltransferase
VNRSPNEQIADIQNVYRYVFVKGLNNADALSQIEIELPASKERDEIVNFIRTSERGIIKSPLQTQGHEASETD